MQEDTGCSEEEGSAEGPSIHEGEQLSIRAQEGNEAVIEDRAGRRFSTEHSEGGEPEGRRFCGRCQKWIDTPVGELHFCAKAARKIGYEWREHDQPAIAKNSILQEGRPFKRGKLIAIFPAEAQDRAEVKTEAGALW